MATEQNTAEERRAENDKSLVERLARRCGANLHVTTSGAAAQGPQRNLFGGAVATLVRAQRTLGATNIGRNEHWAQQNRKTHTKPAAAGSRLRALLFVAPLFVDQQSQSC